MQVNPNDNKGDGVMRRLSRLALLAMIGLSNVGCVMVLGVSDFGEHPRVVEIDGELYVVDEDSHRVRRIEIEFPANEGTPARSAVDPTDD